MLATLRYAMLRRYTKATLSTALQAGRRRLGVTAKVQPNFFQAPQITMQT
jgi:hypothetical protein